jgi:EAL domain-containing protein (putative c-di-GMP-specific phosphodiesterase class I)
METANDCLHEISANSRGCHILTSEKARHIAALGPIPWCITGWKDPAQRLSKSPAQFVLFSQPIFNLGLADDDRHHFEILVQLKEEGLDVPPSRAYLSISAFCKHGPKLDRYVLRRALMCHCGDPRDVGSVLHIKLCRGTLADRDFPAFVADELKAAGLGGDSLCFEMPNVNEPSEPHTREFARRLRAVGCTIAVGNLGAEHISFRPAYHLSAGFTKIAGSLTRDVVVNKTAAARIRAIAHACRDLGIHAVAQHIKDRNTLNMLRDLGVGYAQGRAISEPEPL